ncbi:MAG TPA: IS1182 family transposase [Solirubrobacteraceae bacterium]|nr:IS1182 family transposase [Solirubrobacteraceae bacterium]
MLVTQSAQVGMFDAAVLARPLPEGSFYALLAEHGDRIVRDEDFAECYSRRMGRPSIPPSLLAKVMLLQHRTGASDEQAMECVAWDLRWKVALGLPVDHQGWHPTSLTKYRARLLLHKQEGLALENTLRLAEELGMLEGTAEQIIDSTPMLGAAATQDTVRLVRHGVRKLIDTVKTADKDAGEKLDDGLAFDYERPGEKPDCRWREKAERARMLTRVAQDAERALEAVEQSDGLLDDELVKAAHALLRELIGQDFDIDQDGVPRLHRGTRSDRIISTVDPEMRHGRKSSQSRFDGYKLSAAASNSSEPLILAVHVTAAGEPDGPQAKHLIDSEPPERRPERILGDTAYGNGPVRAELADRDVDVLAPVPEPPVAEGRLAKRDFEINLESGIVTCPAGHQAVIGTQPSGRRRALFSKALCRDCPLRSRCIGPRSAQKNLAIQPDEELQSLARRALQDPVTAEHLRRSRPRIERLLGLLVHRYGARKSRYIGSAKARMQAAWAAALVNLNPIGHRLTSQNA